MKKQIPLAMVLFMGLAIIPVMGMNHANAESQIPKDLAIENEFQPGIGNPVGKVLIVKGEVIILRHDAGRGYRAEKGLPLFQHDTLITGEKGSIRIQFNDGSRLTLAANTRMSINKMLYIPETKSRSTFLKLTVGKIRCWVKKLGELKDGN